jgi:hypothetical protein
VSTSRPTPRRAALALALLVVTVPAACGDDGSPTPAAARRAEPAAPEIDPGDGGRYDPDISPADFVDGVDHPYLPLAPGSSWVYEGTADGEVERIEVVVTPERRQVMGISAVVVRDTVTAAGELVEDTFDWYAQDRDGNVWYLGEETREYEGGEVSSTAGSWEAGVDGALPGIVMAARPTVGHAYRQEYYRGEAEDLAEVVRLGDRARVPFGVVDELLVTKEWNPFEPETVEEKSYAPGVGLVLEVKTAGGEGRVELVEHRRGS